MSARYAIYFSPAQHSAWWTFGAHWLGRDEFLDAPLTPPELTQLTAAEWHRVTAAPRRYGFHATLKAPFRLRVGHPVEDLVARLRALANTLHPLDLGPMQVVTLGDFVALVPDTAPQQLATLAAHCVTELDELRAPLSGEELARRQLESLDARALELLHRYGYPHVLERFRLHFSLTGPVDQANAQRVLQEVALPLAQLNVRAPLVLDRLCLFVEPMPGQAFVRIADAELSA